MANDSSSSAPLADRLDVVLAEYLRRTDRGESVDRAALLAEHPDLAEDLREFFSNVQLFQRVIAPTNGSAASLSMAHVRYFGDYELLEEIAHGGMGVILRATDTILRREVAIKVLKDKFIQGSAAARRFADRAKRKESNRRSRSHKSDRGCGEFQPAVLRRPRHRSRCRHRSQTGDDANSECEQEYVVHTE